MYKFYEALNFETEAIQGPFPVLSRCRLKNNQRRFIGKRLEWRCTIFPYHFSALKGNCVTAETHKWVETCNYLLYASKQASDYSIC